MSDELKPCAHCGSNDVYVPQDLDESFLGWVYCRNCESQGPTIDIEDHLVSDYESAIIEAWNTRTAPKNEKE